MSDELGPPDGDADRNYPGRPWWWFWSIERNTAHRVRGFQTQDPRCFWVPEDGYSLWLGLHLFKDEKVARVELIDSLIAQKRRIDDLITQARFGGGSV